MFCSKCGKTLKNEAAVCPHCGAPVGDSKFEGSGYTAAQGVFPAEGGARGQGRYTPYTRTTYTSMNENEEDVYARTSYRPVLPEQEGAVTNTAPEPPAEEAQPQPEAEEALAPAQAEDAPEAAPAQAAPDAATEADAAPALTPEEDKELKELGISLAPLEPIKKKGISPEVQKYIERMEESKGGGRPAKKRRRKGPAVEDDLEGAQAPAEDAQADGEDEEEEDAPRLRRPAGKKKWILRIAAAVGILALLAGGVVLLAYLTQEKSPIEGVSLSFFEKGVAELQNQTTADARKEYLALAQGNADPAALTAALAAYGDRFKALVPEQPKENDDKFLETLLGVRKAIDEAVSYDSIAALALSSGEETAQSVASIADEAWMYIDNAVKRVADSKTMQDLKNAMNDASMSANEEAQKALQEAQATPTPSPYTTIKKGMKNNRAVRDMQRRLIELKYFSGNADGDYGAATLTAVKKFQQTIGVEVDGIVTAEQQEILYSADAPVYSAEGRHVVVETPTPSPSPTPDPNAAPAS